MKNWDIMTPDLKKNISEQNDLFKILDEDEVLKFESGDLFEKILFGKVF